MTRVAEISVAISTLERPDALARCLAALDAGEVRPAEIVVVDQSRDERTATLVAERRAAGQPIVCVRQHARGLGTSQNAAIGAATRAIVAVTDDDCIPAPDWLATVERLFAERPELGLVGGRVLPLPPEGDRVHPVSSRTSERPLELRGRTLPWLLGSGNNFALRRELFLAIGGCDARLGPGSPARGGVDMDLFYRLLRTGARGRYEPALLVRHERESLAGRLGRRPMYGRGTGAWLAFLLRAGDLYALRLLAAWLRLRTGLLARAALRGHWGAVREEFVMLRSTGQGIVHGMRAGARPRVRP